MESLVSINITIGDKLINPTKLPILFYWDGNNDLRKLIVSDKELREHIKNSITSLDEYDKCDISYFYFKFDGNEEKYTEHTIHIKDFMSIDDINESIIMDMICNVCKNLYFNVFGKAYEIEMIVTENPELSSIQDMYAKIIEKYGKRVSKETFVNYILSKLVMSGKNKEILQERLNKMI